MVIMHETGIGKASFILQIMKIPSMFTQYAVKKVYG